MKQTATTTRDAKRVPLENLVIFVVVIMFAALVALVSLPYLPIERATALTVGMLCVGAFAMGPAILCELCERFAK